MNLQELYRSKGFNYYPTDKGTKHSYLDVYNELFNSFKDQSINLIEIGIDQGGSLRLFSDWFTQANIIGYDIIQNSLRVPIERSKLIIKNCMDFTENEFKDYPPTIIIDDASHMIEHQLRMVKICYPQLLSGGMLIIEDIQNIMYEKSKFDALGIPYKLYDLRIQKNKYDDILLVFKKP